MDKKAATGGMMADEPAKKRMIVLKIEGQAVENIHNDVANASYYFMRRIVDRKAEGDLSGISIEMMAGLTMTAFWVEAGINYLGITLNVDDWTERETGKKKLAKVLKHLGLAPDLTNRPWSVVRRLKDFRDTLAHGKPETLEHEETIVRPFGYADRPEPLRSDWVKLLTVEAVVECYEDTNAIWLAMLAAAGMTEMDATSHGSSGISYLGEAGHEEIAE